MKFYSLQEAVDDILGKNYDEVRIKWDRINKLLETYVPLKSR